MGMSAAQPGDGMRHGMQRVGTLASEGAEMVNYSAVFLAAFAAISGVTATDYPTPGPTYDASSYTTWEDKTVANSKKAKIYVPFTAADGSEDMVSIYRLDLVGNDYERGYAHGYLMAKGT